MFSRTDWRKYGNVAYSIENSASVGTVGISQIDPNIGFTLYNVDQTHNSNNYLDSLALSSAGWTWDLNASSSLWGNNNEYPFAMIPLQKISTDIQSPMVPVRIACSLGGLGARNNELHGIGMSGYDDPDVNLGAIMIGSGFYSSSVGVVWGQRSSADANFVVQNPIGVYDAVMFEVVGGGFKCFWGVTNADGTPPDAFDSTKWFQDSGSAPGVNIGSNGASGSFGDLSNTRTLYLWAQNSNTSNLFAPIFKVLDIWYCKDFALY